MTDLLNADDAAQALGGIGRTTLWQLIRDGRLDTVKIGRRLFIPRDSIDALIEANRTTADAPLKSVPAPVRCPSCGKWLKSDAGMAGHVSRMHRVVS